MRNGIVFGILLHLIKHGRTSAKTLATKFEISEKSVYRYITQLDIAGVPTITHRGRGGGVEIYGRYSLSDSFFSKREIATLHAMSNALPLGDGERMVMKSKLLSNCEQATEIFDFESSIIFDNSPWLTTKNKEEDREILLQAIEQRRTISFDYNKNGKFQRRTASPHSLIFKEGQFYIFAYCHLRKAIRLFRVSRTKNIHIEIDSNFYEYRFSRNEIISAINASFDEIDINLEIKKEAESKLEEFVDISKRWQCENKNIVIAKAKNTSDLTYKLLEFEDDIRVISPLWLKDKILQICKNISQNYSK